MSTTIVKGALISVFNILCLRCRQESSSQQSNAALDFELPFMSKFLLLAAYVAGTQQASPGPKVI